MESSVGERGFRPLESASPGSVSVVWNLQRAAGPTLGLWNENLHLNSAPRNSVHCIGFESESWPGFRVAWWGRGSCGLEEPGPTLQNSHLI